jgi:hypothetical protein
VPLDTLTWLLRIGERHARTILLKDHASQLMPFYHLVVPGRGQDIVIPGVFDSVEEKEAYAATARMVSRLAGATAALFVTEAWLVKRDLRDEGVPITQWHRDRMLEAFRQGPPPSEDPNRIEVVSLFVTDGKKNRGVNLQIVRDKPGGKIIALVKEKYTDDTNFEGRMLDDLIESPT